MEQDPYRYFRPEARNLLDQFAQGILELEKGGGGGGAVQRLLRLAHTLKGAARVVRQSSIAERAHAIEDALAPFRESAAEIAREDIDAILAHLDEIGSQLVTLVPDQAAEIPEGGRYPAPPPQDGVTASANASGPDPRKRCAKSASRRPRRCRRRARGRCGSTGAAGRVPEQRRFDRAARSPRRSAPGAVDRQRRE